jgi:hypothetical protein
MDHELAERRLLALRNGNLRRTHLSRRNNLEENAMCLDWMAAWRGIGRLQPRTELGTLRVRILVADVQASFGEVPSVIPVEGEAVDEREMAPARMQDRGAI